tara:strand:- start:235 stop:705 length:471 start_codon:yes stop_codon:yes gene_type:complete
MDIIEEKNLNYFQKNFKCNNPEQIIPLNLGKKWTHDEEIILLRELDNNIDIEIIAEKHKRTKGSILSRQKEIAYKMYIKNISMKEIINKTKLQETTINEFIEKKRYNNNINKNKIEDKDFSVENEIVYIKKDIKELKNTLKELVEMIKAIYDFEDS